MILGAIRLIIVADIVDHYCNMFARGVKRVDMTGFNVDNAYHNLKYDEVYTI